MPRSDFKPGQQSACSPAGNKATGQQDAGSVHGISAGLPICAEQGILHFVLGIWQKVNPKIQTNLIHIYPVVLHSSLSN